MKKKILLILLSGFITLGVSGCNHSGGNIKNVEVKKVASEMYSQEEIESAIEIILEEFNKEWNGCTLNEIYYSGDEQSSAYQDWAKRNNADEVIVLLSSFDVDSSGKDKSLNPNDTYNNWQWILVRNKGQQWIHVDHGY